MLLGLFFLKKASPNLAAPISLYLNVVYEISLQKLPDILLGLCDLGLLHILVLF